MIDRELYIMLNDIFGKALDKLIDQMREILRELVPKGRFEEWDKKVQAAQANAKSFRNN